MFLEAINNILMTGQIPGLFAKDEMIAMTGDLSEDFLKERPHLDPTQLNLNNFFICISKCFTTAVSHEHCAVVNGKLCQEVKVRVHLQFLT
jgi:hypothetical protein